MTRIAAAGLVVALTLSGSFGTAADIRLAGNAAELSVAPVSERTVRIVVAPLDEMGKPRSGSPSTVLVLPEPKPLFTARELADARQVEAGKLRVRIQPDPLTIAVFGSDDAIVQEFVFADDGAMSFRTPAPVLGLGEGARQFDRRGGYYRMVNGQIPPLLATHGATIPVPFLIGTDGWAFLLHRPWGEFDLRENRGKFIPQQSSLGREPFELFVIRLQEPADALAEYIRLTGRPVMPPKWVLGYVQSHRTLAGPQEPLEIARTFREKKLPADAVIYLGTGYCPAGWNTGHGSVEFNPKMFDHHADTINGLHDLNFKIVLHINRAPRNMFGASITEESDNPIHRLTVARDARMKSWSGGIRVFNVELAGGSTPPKRIEFRGEPVTLDL